jgi:starch synthase (maltosyl-transferring)
MAFWAWCIAAVQDEHPDVLFRAEAFTRPRVMEKLAEVGFSQSYTYFTWRTRSDELQEYLEELAHGPNADFMRPNFWPNTPDILSGPLRNGPPAVFKLRAVLAATLTPSYGIYSGYELLENEPMSDTNEEYFHSEKYEVSRRNWDDPRSIAPLLAQLNDIRRRHPALQRLRNITFHPTTNPDVLAFSKVGDDGADVVLTVVNLNAWETAECTIDLALDSLGLPWDRPYEAYDELTRQSFTWQGRSPYVRLDPFHEVAHVLQLRPLS